MTGTSATAVRRRQLAQDLADSQGGICPWCKLSLPGDVDEIELDHIIPKSLGAPRARWNLAALHRKCNRIKRATLTADARELAQLRGLTLGRQGEPEPPLWVKLLNCDRSEIAPIDEVLAERLHTAVQNLEKIIDWINWVEGQRGA